MCNLQLKLSVSVFVPVQDNNIIAIGMEDAVIQIYNVRLDEVSTVLNTHTTAMSCLLVGPSRTWMRTCASIGTPGAVEVSPQLPW